MLNVIYILAPDGSYNLTLQFAQDTIKANRETLEAQIGKPVPGVAGILRGLDYETLIGIGFGK